MTFKDEVLQRVIGY